MGANLKLKGEVEKRKEKTKKPPMKLVGHAANFSDPRRSCLINSGKTNRDETLFFCLFNIFFFFFFREYSHTCDDASRYLFGLTQSIKIK